MMPMTGFHSVIDRPDKVSRVMPPTTTIRKISPQQIKSHVTTAPCRVLSVAVFAASGRLAIVEKDTLRSRENDRLRGKVRAARRRGKCGERPVGAAPGEP